MAYWFVRQPNGLFARFSTIVDDFTDTNMTNDEAFNLALDDCGREMATRMIRDAASDVAVRGAGDVFPEDSGSVRWRQTLRKIERIHGSGVSLAWESSLSSDEPQEIGPPVLGAIAPGPWHFKPVSDWIDLYDSYGNLIGMIRGDNALANATAVVAVPQLIAACEKALKYLDNDPFGGEDGGIVRELRQAIADAKGVAQ